MLFKDWDIELIGEHIRVVPMKEQDRESYSKLMFGPLYDKMMELSEQPPTDIEKILNHTENQETHAIRFLGDDTFIGFITLQTNDEEKLDIGISLIPEEQNKGYGPEAVRLFANRLHKEYGLTEISVRIEEKNLQSQNAFAKVGAVFEKKAPDKVISELRKKVKELTSKEPEVPVSYYFYYHIPLPIERILPSTHTLTRDEIVTHQAEYENTKNQR